MRTWKIVNDSFLGCFDESSKKYIALFPLNRPGDSLVGVNSLYKEIYVQSSREVDDTCAGIIEKYLAGFGFYYNEKSGFFARTELFIDPSHNIGDKIYGAKVMRFDESGRPKAILIPGKIVRIGDIGKTAGPQYSIETEEGKIEKFALLLKWTKKNHNLYLKQQG